jgi:hypothetical protein
MGLFKRVFKVGKTYSISSTGDKKRNIVPLLRFSGIWLTEKAGLKTGDRVQVFAEQGKIAVLKIEKGGVIP